MDRIRWWNFEDKMRGHSRTSGEASNNALFYYFQPAAVVIFITYFRELLASGFYEVIFYLR